ncbi:isopenicillin N synthase family oxygenase [Oculatella sp. LEGE 06141]|uniref:isopenicillin N synthase family dioxygenase n=1 Tax=Oculatella sp. LEGE 06141 TaxID=1828648 RepID=UPI0018825619|nr:2OG-Fe(II) oxygenase family protein [Oculatella sp. LEGE 06141]MBE9178275.1 isopenicillin N synthase family oxygenase [Oculatella sp. LEGE 06141]
MAAIPVVDFHAFRCGSFAERQCVVAQMYQAFHQVGFLYLKSVGMPPGLLEQMFAQSQQFFQQPLAVKQSLAWSTAICNRGYVAIARERLNPAQPGDLKEAFNMGRERPREANDPTLTNVWPSALPYFRETALAFYEACTALVAEILQAMALSLRLPSDFWVSRHCQQQHTLRLLHYPPLVNPPDPGQLRAGAHSDYGSITLLFQDAIGGLEVQTASGEWTIAPPLADTVLINLGDLMERWTNHTFRSTQHRVVIPANAARSRYSIAFFCHPDDEVEVACLEPCQSSSHPPLYPPILAKDYLLSRLQATY